MLYGLLQHSIALLTFQHKGEGLPKTSGPTAFLFWLVVLSTLARMWLMPALEEDVSDIAVPFFVTIICLFIIFVRHRQMGTAFFLICIGTDLILGGFYLFGMTGMSIDGTIMLWKLAALTVIGLRLGPSEH